MEVNLKKRSISSNREKLNIQNKKIKRKTSIAPQ